MNRVVVFALSYLLAIWLWLLGAVAVRVSRRCGARATIVFLLFCIMTTIDADKPSDRSGSGSCPRIEQVVEVSSGLRDGEMDGGSTNFTITAYSATASNHCFAAAWPAGFIPHGSRIELHEKSPSLTNGWACVRQYVVEPGQTNLCDTIAITNGSPPSAFYRLYVDALAISFPLLPSTVRTSGYCLTVATSADSIPVVVERSERPQEYPAPDLGFAENPFVSCFTHRSFTSASQVLSCDTPTSSVILKAELRHARMQAAESHDLRQVLPKKRCLQTVAAR